MEKESLKQRIDVLEKERNIVNNFALSEGIQLPSFNDNVKFQMDEMF